MENKNNKRNNRNGKSLFNKINEFLGNPIYIKPSVSKNGTIVGIHKFRTMKLDADDHFEHVEKNGYNDHGKLLEDYRVTKIGKILRPFFLDELPQLVDLIAGRLKFVGIAPMREEDWKSYPEDLKEFQKNTYPGLLRAQYFYKKNGGGKEAHFNNLREYKRKYETNPSDTDIRWGIKILTNILAGRVKSS